MTEVRARFGPSLKTPVTVGALRIAVFNYALAKARGGKFVLRIEDTDRTRLRGELIDDLYETLDWAAVEYDEGGLKGGPYGPYAQSQRLPTYRRYAEELLDRGTAYVCFCTPDRLERMRDEQRRAGHRPRYDRACASLDPVEARERAVVERHVVRMRIPDGTAPILVRDLLHGDIPVRAASLDDQILLKSDGFPTYHFSSVVDDHLMRISDVLRASVWIPSTAKHLLLCEWLGWKSVRFIHVSPVPSGPGSVAVRDLRRDGVPPAAVVNFVGALGWRGVAGREVFVLREMIETFSVDQLRRSCGSADEARLRWLSAQHLRRQAPEEIAEAAVPFLRDEGLDPGTFEFRRAAIRLIGPRLKSYRSVATEFRYLFADPRYQPTDLEVLGRERDLLRAVGEAVAELSPFSRSELELALRGLAEARQVPLPALLRAVRTAVYGVPTGPDLYGTLELLGRRWSVERVRRALDLTGTPAPP